MMTSYVPYNLGEIGSTCLPAIAEAMREAAAGARSSGEDTYAFRDVGFTVDLPLGLSLTSDPMYGELADEWETVCEGLHSIFQKSADLVSDAADAMVVISTRYSGAEDDAVNSMPAETFDPADEEA